MIVVDRILNQNYHQVTVLRGPFQNPHHVTTSGPTISCPGDMEMKLVLPSASPDSNTQESINNLGEKSIEKEKGPGLKKGCITGITPYAPCMQYLPTFALKITQKYVSIPYMEHMGTIVT
jgi:hypothetical protein